MRVQRYGLFLIPPNIFGTFFQKMLFMVMLASDDKHENMVKINTEVFDSYKGKPVTSVFIGVMFIAYSLSPM
jgi:hypothetical protein